MTHDHQYRDVHPRQRSLRGCEKYGYAVIAGRLVQGIGAGGINVLIEIIICDSLPLRETRKILGYHVRSHRSRYDTGSALR